jgi:hypothetical protein
MNRTRFGILAFLLLLASCAQTELSQQTDLSIDTYRPPLDALGIAETRAKEYWTKHQAELGQATRYLAIESYPIFSDEIPDLALKLENSPGVNSSDLEEYETDLEVSISCVNIFDTRAQKLVSPEGYAVVDLPARGNIARFGPYTARFIGTGG